MKADEYTIKFLDQIQKMFDPESENHISLDELEEGENLKHFLHAISNVVPTYMYGKLTSHETSLLDYNHIANKMCFEFSKMEKDSD